MSLTYPSLFLSEMTDVITPVTIAKLMLQLGVNTKSSDEKGKK